ncbi:hypothetical protein BTVI_111000 [Pitangus sulphuratus]|nr:hypothetical protein BTVI_111000 [Pitangus sulphuratus]
MAGKEPLLSALKGAVLQLREAGGPCTDTSPHLVSLCQRLESILRKGLRQPAWGFRRRDYWHWLKQLPTGTSGRPTRLSMSIQRAGGCERTRTAQGRGRYFLRLALQGKVLAVAVRELAQTPGLLEFYDPESSILGSEGLRGKMVAHPRYVEGRVFVTEVLPDSQAEVDEVVLAGDILDEINGCSLRYAHSGQAGDILQKLKGQPLIFRLLRWRWHDGQVYEPLLPYLKVLKEKEPHFQLQHSPRHRGKGEPRQLRGGRLLYNLQYLGQTSIGTYGGKEVLEQAIPAVLEGHLAVQEVLLDVKEAEILVQEKVSSKVQSEHFPPPQPNQVGLLRNLPEPSPKGGFEYNPISSKNLEMRL